MDCPSDDELCEWAEAFYQEIMDLHVCPTNMGPIQRHLRECDECSAYILYLLQEIYEDLRREFNRELPDIEFFISYPYLN